MEAIDEARTMFGDTIMFDGWQNTCESFAEIFADAFPNPTHEKLSEIDGGTKGYVGLFDQWKEQGLIA